MLPFGLQVWLGRSVAVPTMAVQVMAVQIVAVAAAAVAVHSGMVCTTLYSMKMAPDDEHPLLILETWNYATKLLPSACAILSQPYVYISAY